MICQNDRKKVKCTIRCPWRCCNNFSLSNHQSSNILTLKSPTRVFRPCGFTAGAVYQFTSKLGQLSFECAQVIIGCLVFLYFRRKKKRLDVFIEHYMNHFVKRTTAHSRHQQHPVSPLISNNQIITTRLRGKSCDSTNYLRVRAISASSSAIFAWMSAMMELDYCRVDRDRTRRAMVSAAKKWCLLYMCWFCWRFLPSTWLIDYYFTVLLFATYELGYTSLAPATKMGSTNRIVLA